MRRASVLLVVAILALSCGCNMAVGSSGPAPSESVENVGDSSGADCLPGSGEGCIKGILLSLDDTPSPNSVLYVGDYSGSEDAQLAVVLDISKHPCTTTDEDGEFCLTGIVPGKYGLIVWDGVESVLLNDPDTGYSLQIDVYPGEVVELGAIHTPLP